MKVNFKYIALIILFINSTFLLAFQVEPDNETDDVFVEREFSFYSSDEDSDNSGESIIYQPRYFDVNVVEKFKADDDFAYQENEKRDLGIETWFERLMKRLFGTGKTASVVSKVFEYLLIFSCVALLIWFIFRSQIKGAFVKKDNKNHLPKVSELDINIEEDVLQNRLTKAENEKDFRESVRLQYLIILKELNEKDLIRWKDHKLSQDYVRELKDRKLRKEFRLLTKYFNYAWYGNNKVNENYYASTKSVVSDVKNKIQS